MKNLFNKIRKAFGDTEEGGVQANLNNILKFLGTFESHYGEIKEFRQGLEDYTKSVFKSLI